MRINRREFVRSAVGGSLSLGLSLSAAGAAPGKPANGGVSLPAIRRDEDLFAFIERTRGRFDVDLYRRILGAANEFKEGDQIIGVAAADDRSRSLARELLARTRVGEVDAHPVFEDGLHLMLAGGRPPDASRQAAELTFAGLKRLLLTAGEEAIKEISRGLSSDVIGAVVKLMSNPELIAIGAKVFNPLPGSRIGAKGYLGARIQPNSPTDNIEDVVWQVFDGWSYAVGDVVLGTNPVSSDPKSVQAIELALKDLLVTFGVDHVMPHCVLAHIDVQAAVERADPGSTALWFQSIAGSDAANKTFSVSLEQMLGYAQARTGKYGLYFETGQGADFTNGHGHGFDMVLHESRKYGFARALTQQVAQAQESAGAGAAPWVHLNDVAGFIGPEVFRTREQLVRCCLEDIVMGKLHGLTIGLDVCATLHMDVSPDDLDWCLDEIMPANPAYLMALPTKIDPMLGYLTTGYQDHVRLRGKFAYRVNDPMWAFFQELGVIDAAGRPTEHFGDPLWVYLQYRRRKGDPRDDEEILEAGRKQLAAVRSRGVFMGGEPWELEAALHSEMQRIYADAKQSIWAELTPEFISSIPDKVVLATRSATREDYILHPVSGEQLSPAAAEAVRRLRSRHEARFDVQIVISDGLNALAIMDDGHLHPFLSGLRTELESAGYRPAAENVVVNSGRVRAGYRIGEILFGGLPGDRAILHVIGERPGTGHHTFSVYLTAPSGALWGRQGEVDHNITKVVSGIATTALLPTRGAIETVRILRQIAPPLS